MDDLKKFVDGVEEDNNVLLCFYEAKKDVATPMLETLASVMDDEQAFVISVAKIDRTKANEDILKHYKIEWDTILAIDKTKNGYPAVKTLQNFIEMKVRKIVVSHKAFNPKK